MAKQLSEMDYEQRNAELDFLTVAVVVPTFRRPADLERCLLALSRQRRKANEVIVVVRDIDAETQQMLAGFDESILAIRKVTVTVPGQVQALNAGLRAINSHIMAITDDDAAPHDDWLERIVAHMAARDDLAGVGGRDHMYVNGVLMNGRKHVVGIVPRFGGHVGNHHLGFGEPREVDILKGVNGSYRVAAIRGIGFDERLRGIGAQVHWEISLGLALTRRGWKLLYDPMVAVDHFLAPRFDEDQRNSFNAIAARNAAFNESFIRLEHLNAIERIVFLLWAVSIGSRGLPGIAQVLRFFPTQGLIALRKFAACTQGRREAWWAITTSVARSDE